MYIRWPFFTIYTALFFCSSAMAECELSKYRCITECMNYSTSDRGFCYRDKQNEAEAKLQATYNELIQLAKKWDPKMVESLQAAQKTWLRFREHNCKVYDITDIELRGAKKDDCILRMTRERMRELELLNADINR